MIRSDALENLAAASASWKSMLEEELERLRLEV